MAGTRRQQIIALLAQGAYGVGDLARELGVRVKDVTADLKHVARSAQGRLRVEVPASCLSCGHELPDRTRFTAPSRCPRCRSERTSEPLMRLAP